MSNRLVAAGLVLALGVLTGAISIFSGAMSLLYRQLNAAIIHPTLRVALPAPNEEGRRLLTALQQEIASDGTRLRISFVEAPSLEASARALAEQTAEVAAVRADGPAAAAARAVFVLKTLHVVLLAPATGGVDRVSKLKGSKIGVPASNIGIDPLVKRVLDFYGIEDKQIVQLRPSEVAGALQHKQVAALAVVGETGAGPIADAIEALHTATKRLPRFLDLSDAQTLAERFAVYEEAEISAGAFAPALPSEKVETLATKVVLVARSSLSNYSAGELTRLLLATKSSLAATWPHAGQLAAPSTEKRALPLAHPGTIAFLDAEQSDLLDKSTNVLLLGSVVTGFLGWIATRLASLRNKRRCQELKERMQRLPMLLAQANSATPDLFDGIEAELDQLSRWLLRKFMEDEISSSDFNGAEARLTHITGLIRQKRRSAELTNLEQFYREWQSSPARAS